MPHPARFVARFTIGLILLGAAGCANEGDISVYTVSREEIPATDSTLGAMIPQGEQAWFFKLSGPKPAVDQLATAFETFVKSVRIGSAGGTPTWTLPEGWKQRSGDEMRFATIDIPAEGKNLELTISKLPMQGQGEDEYLLANVNRWRGQLGLPRIGRSQLADEVRRLEVDGGTATLMQLAGKLKASSRGDMPRLGMGGAGASAPPPARSEIKHEAPEGWKRSAGNSLSILAYEVVDGDRRVETTLTRLTVEAGQLVPNVNRWRGQIGLPPLEDDELKKTVQKVPCGTNQADFVELIGPGGEEGGKAILGAIVLTDNASWFFKLMGDADLAVREKDRFLALVKSTELE